MYRRRWRFILNIVDGLPSNSHYIAAVADDDEIAAQAGDAKPQPPRLTEWSSEVQALAAVVDRLGDLIRGQVAQGGNKPPKLRPYPRPVTALDRVKQQRRLERHHALVARVLPNRPPQ